MQRLLALKRFFRDHFVRANIALIGILGFVLLGTVPVIYYSLTVPTGGHITDLNAGGAKCVQTNGSNVFIYVSCPGVNPTPAPSASPPITVTGTWPYLISCLVCAVKNADNNFSASQSVTGAISATTTVTGTGGLVGPSVSISSSNNNQILHSHTIADQYSGDQFLHFPGDTDANDIAWYRNPATLLAFEVFNTTTPTEIFGVETTGIVHILPQNNNDAVTINHTVNNQYTGIRYLHKAGDTDADDVAWYRNPASQFGFEVYDVTTAALLFGVDTNGNATVPHILTAENVKITSATASSPVCTDGSKFLTTAGCTAAQVYTLKDSDTIAPTPMATGTPAPYTTYATEAVTTGVSSGASGAWLVQVQWYGSISGTGTVGSAQLCITGAAAGASGGGSYSNPGVAVCAQSPTNPRAGAYYQFTSGSTQYANMHAIWEAVFANSTTATFNCQASVSGVTSPEIAGVCYATATPI